jgi:hypothetical protein
MPLTNGYGVVVGSIHKYYRDPPDHYGKYYHGNLLIDVQSAKYHCAIDVDSKNTDIGVEWCIVPVAHSDLSKILRLGIGYHGLRSSPTSGAIDYIRGNIPLALTMLFRPISTMLARCKTRSWKKGRGIDALKDLEPLVHRAKSKSLLALIYGEPFTNGKGLHNIHQNQGDPEGSQWWDENGIWQDGCTILQQSSTTFAAFLNKFSSQAHCTDENGHPANTR